jgi:hypothetical protein
MAVVCIRFFDRHDHAFLNIFRKTFGMSSNLRSLCSMILRGKTVFWLWLESTTLEFNRGFRCDDGRFCSSSVYRWSFKCCYKSKTIAQLAVGIDTPNGKLMPDALFGPDIFILKRYFDLVNRRRFNRFWNPLRRWMYFWCYFWFEQHKSHH